MSENVLPHYLRKALTSSVSCWPEVFRIRVPGQKASVRGKASSYIIPSAEKKKHTSLLLHFTSLLHCNINSD